MSYITPTGREIYRDRTDNHSKMAGVTFLSFKCPCCKTIKPVQGRKSRGYKIGFRCAECAEKVASKGGKRCEKVASK